MEEEEEDEDMKRPAKKFKRPRSRDENDDEDANSDEAGSADEGEWAEVEGEDDDDGEDEGEWTEVVGDDDDGDDDERDTTVDVSSFQYPAGYSGPCPIFPEQTLAVLSNHSLIINPLASLLRMDETTRYYNARFGKDEETKKDEDVFLLNINYAGTYPHESSIRVAMRDDTDRRYLNKLYQSTRGKHKSSNALDGDLVQEVASACPSLLHCLLYHGYCILIPKQPQK